MINLVAVRNNLQNEIKESKDDLDGFTFRCSMGLAEVLLEALDLAIMDLGTDSNGSCYVGDSNAEHYAFRTRINSLIQEYCNELNDLNNACSVSNQFETVSSTFLKEQRIRTMGKLEAMLKVLGG